MFKKTSTFNFLLLIVFIFSCSSDRAGNFELKGSIKGLKKGMVYLQKDGDSGLVNLDSIRINGQSEFILKTNLEEPVLLYLSLLKNDNEDHYIPFFADLGTTEISTTLKSFNFDAKIKGSKQQQLLEDYTKVVSQFNNQNLDLIKADFMAQQSKNMAAIDSLSKRSATLLKRKYSYAIQYAINNKDSEIAPYLALYEIPNANPKYIDSVYGVLTDNIKNSFYGRKLGEVVKTSKSQL